MKSIAGVLLTALAILLVLSGHPRDAGATFAGGNGRLTYSYAQEIYVANADGSNPVNVTNNDVYDFDSAFSPDGTMIAFTSERDGDREIYVMNDDGTDQHNITSHPDGQDFEPSWSPDGSHILYRRAGAIWSIEPDGDNAKELIDLPGEDAAPEWSADGTMITFANNFDDDFEIYAAEADGDNPVKLTDNTFGDFDPVWSPDGSKIAFSRTNAAETEAAIYVMDADGTDEFLLVDTPGEDDGVPDWSPDGALIVYSSDALWAIPATGSDEPRFIANGYRSSWEAVTQPSLVQGDVNCDGTVTPEDGTALIAHQANLPFPHAAGCPTIGAEVASLFGDVDCFGSLNMIDALLVFRHLAGLSVAQNTGCPAIGAAIAN